MTFANPPWSENFGPDSPFLVRNGQLGCVMFAVKHNEWRDWTLRVQKSARPVRGRVYTATMENDKFPMNKGFGAGNTCYQAIGTAIINARLSDSMRKYLTVGGRRPKEPEIPNAKIYTDDWMDEFTEPEPRVGVGLLP